MALTVAMTLTCGAFASCGNTEKDSSSKASDDKGTAAQTNNGGDTVTSGDEDVSENSFSSAILSVLPEDAEDFRELYSASTTGVHHGYYTHFEETGACAIKIRANSNIKDESASFYYQLEKDALYEYSFELVEIDEKKVVIRNFQLKKISEVTE